MNNAQNRFLLDSDCFIESQKRFYRFSFVPAFWDTLLKEHSDTKIHTLSAAVNEIDRGNDRLKNWIRDHVPNDFVLESDSETQKTYSAIKKWVDSHTLFSRAEKEKFASAADGWLIAHAKTHKMTVVTLEQPVDKNSTKIKIPNVCQRFNVLCYTLYDFLESLNVRFILESTNK
ncbi:MAG: DUF4411 family protein [Thermoguttaceae bacterium]